MGKRNPYQKFKMPGVKGSVPSNFEVIKIFDKAGESIVIYVANLSEDAFDYGYEVNLKNGSHMKKIPGVGQGWFEKYDYTLGFAMYAVLLAFTRELSDSAKMALKAKIQLLQMPKLDLI